MMAAEGLVVIPLLNPVQISVQPLPWLAGKSTNQTNKLIFQTAIATAMAVYLSPDEPRSDIAAVRLTLAL
jgi:hypothetical protein